MLFKQVFLALDKKQTNGCFIDVIFKNFKNNGLKKGDTHVNDLVRLETLYGILTIGYVNAIKTGIIEKTGKLELHKISRNGRPKFTVYRV